MTHDGRKGLELAAFEHGVTAADIVELQRKRRPPANWQKWAHYPKAELWQCVALSFDVEPVDATMRAVPAGFMMNAEPKPKRWFAEHPEMRERLDMAVANAGLDVLDKLHPLPGSLGDMASRLFSTAEFGAWARSIPDSKIPEAFPGQQPGAAGTVGAEKGGQPDAKPWLEVKDGDPEAKQPWYTPARYFARQLVLKDSTLLTKRLILAGKVSELLRLVDFNKRGGKLALDPATVLKAFSNVTLS